MMGPSNHLPVIIIGAGPCGLAAGVALKQAGLEAVLIEKASVVESIANYPTNLTFFSTPEKLEIGGIKFESAAFRPSRREGLDYYRRVAAEHGLKIRQQERVVRIAAGTGGSTGYSVHTTRAVVPASAVVVATGYFDYPNLLGVPGEDLPHVAHRFVDGHSAFQRHVLVVGGGNSAAEASIELARCGARVTQVHYEAAFTSHVIKPWILPEFEEWVTKGAITVRFSSRVTAITDRWATVTGNGSSAQVPAELIYLMTGYTPKPGLLGELGVPFDAKTGVPRHNPETMETPIPGVFVCGVMTSGFNANGIFIENGRGHGELIARALVDRG
jgi:thioredoxin reductase (NADPH)